MLLQKFKWKLFIYDWMYKNAKIDEWEVKMFLGWLFTDL